MFVRFLEPAAGCDLRVKLLATAWFVEKLEAAETFEEFLCRRFKKHSILAADGTVYVEYKAPGEHVLAVYCSCTQPGSTAALSFREEIGKIHFICRSWAGMGASTISTRTWRISFLYCKINQEPPPDRRENPPFVPSRRDSVVGGGTYVAVSHMHNDVI